MEAGRMQKLSGVAERALMFLARRADHFIVYLLLFVAGTYRQPGAYYSDTWWHLRLGQGILRSGPIFFDSLSHTAWGQPFVDHQWLGNAIFYLVLRWIGPMGVPLLGTLLSIATVAIIWATIRKLIGDHPMQWVAMPLACGFLFSLKYYLRPAVFGEPLLALVLFLVLLPHKWPRRFLFLPAIFALWTNLHLSWTVGLLVVGVVGLGQVLQSKGQRLVQVRQWGLLFLACVGALFVNPYTWRVPVAPLQGFLISTGNLFRYISEWQSPALAPSSFWTWLVLVGFLLPWLAFMFSERRPRFTDVALVIALMAASLVAVRFLLFYGIIVPVVMAPYLASAWDRLTKGRVPARAKSPVNPSTLLLLVELVALLLLPIGWGIVLGVQADNWDWHTGRGDGYMPVEAVEFLQTHTAETPGNLLNPYGWGGYVEWWLPERLVFIDGRTDFFQGPFLEEYIDIANLREPWAEMEQRLVGQWKVGTVLWERHAPLTEVLRLDPDWQLLWEDDVAVVFIRQEQP